MFTLPEGVGMKKKMANEPHAQRRGWLKNGNPPGDFNAAPRCGAKTRKGTPCRCPAMRDKRRCRLHGGASTGPRTAAGLARSRRANWKHGLYSAAADREARQVRQLLRECKELYGEVRASRSETKRTGVRCCLLGLRDGNPSLEPHAEWHNFGPYWLDEDDPTLQNCDFRSWAP